MYFYFWSAFGALSSQVFFGEGYGCKYPDFQHKVPIKESGYEAGLGARLTLHKSLRVSWAAPLQGHELDTKLVQAGERLLSARSMEPAQLCSRGVSSHGSKLNAALPHRVADSCFCSMTVCIVKPNEHREGQCMHSDCLKAYTPSQYKLKLAMGQQRRNLVSQFHFISECTDHLLPMAKGDETPRWKGDAGTVHKFWLWERFFRSKENTKLKNTNVSCFCSWDSWIVLRWDEQVKDCLELYYLCLPQRYYCW